MDIKIGFYLKFLMALVKQTILLSISVILKENLSCLREGREYLFANRKKTKNGNQLGLISIYQKIQILKLQEEKYSSYRLLLHSMKTQNIR